MIRLLLLLALLLPFRALATYAYVAGGDAVDASNGTSLTISSVTFATHETVFIPLTYAGSTRIVESMSDGTNTYTYLGTVSDAATSSQSMAMFMIKDAVAGTYTLTFTLASAAQYRGIGYRRYTGLNNSGTPQFISNVQQNAVVTTDAVTSTNITPSTQPGIFFGVTLEAQGSGSTPSAGTGMTTRGNMPNWDANLSKTMTEDKRFTSTSATAATFTCSNNTNTYITMGAVIDESGGGGGGAASAGRALLLGAGK